MIPNLKYELVKLFTIRSTYVLTLFSVAFCVLIMVLGVINTKQADLTGVVLSRTIINATIMSSLLGSIAAILLVGHEYRYNMISYTLTASRSRTKILGAKLVTAILFSGLLALLCIGVGILSWRLGLHIRHFVLPEQIISAPSMIGRTVLTCIGSALLAWVLALLFRNIIFAIVAMFVLPTIEQLASVWFKHNVAYLPTTALGQAGLRPGDPQALISALQGGIVFGIYIVVGLLIAWILFLRRDAN